MELRRRVIWQSLLFCGVLAAVSACGDASLKEGSPATMNSNVIDVSAKSSTTQSIDPDYSLADGPTKEQLTLARTLVDQASSANGDGKSEPGFVVMATRSAAFPLVFHDPWTGGGDGLVMVVSITGEFGSTTAFDHPPQASAAARAQDYSSLVLFVNPVSQQAEDVYVGSTTVDLSTLGTQIPLP